jgi:hypothetical protein
MKRKVYIRWNTEPGCWLVRYLERKPRQRYCAAQFDKNTHRAYVVSWVLKQGNLELVEEPCF